MGTILGKDGETDKRAITENVNDKSYMQEESCNFSTSCCSQCWSARQE